MIAGASDARARWVVRLLCVGLCLATLAPAAQNFVETPRDGFPFSWYPMFHKPRPAIERRTYMVGLDASGQRRKVPYTTWAKGSYNIGASHINRIATAPKADREAFCARVADAVGRSRTKALRKLVTVQVESGDFSLPSYFGVGLRRAERSKVLVSCPVTREPR